MSNGTYADDAHQLLTRSLSHIARARVVMPDGETVELDVEDGIVSFDESRAPRAQAPSLTCRLPTDPAVLGRLDPRTGSRLCIDAGYRRPGGLEDVHPLTDLLLEDRRVTRPGDRLVLSGLGDEALVIEDSKVTGGLFGRPTTTSAITNVILDVLPAANITVTNPTGGPAISQGDYGDRWDLIMDFADRIDTQVYDNGLRQWFVSPTPTLGTPVLTLATGANGTIVQSDAGLSRDDWANKVILRYRWRDTSDVDHTITSTRRVTSGPYAAVAGNTRGQLVEREVATTQAEADAAATALVKRTVTRGRSCQVTAIAAYWLRPGMTVTVVLPTGEAEDHLVAAVSFALRDGLMTVTTRLPDNAGAIGA